MPTVPLTAIAGRLNLQGVIIGWLRQNRGPHIYNSEEALATLEEAQRLRDFAFEPYGPIDEVRTRLLRCDTLVLTRLRKADAPFF